MQLLPRRKAGVEMQEMVAVSQVDLRKIVILNSVTEVLANVMVGETTAILKVTVPRKVKKVFAANDLPMLQKNLAVMIDSHAAIESSVMKEHHAAIESSVMKEHHAAIESSVMKEHHAAIGSLVMKEHHAAIGSSVM